MQPFLVIEILFAYPILPPPFCGMVIGALPKRTKPELQADETQLWMHRCWKIVYNNIAEDQDAFDHDKEQKSVISGRRLHWKF